MQIKLLLLVILLVLFHNQQSVAPQNVTRKFSGTVSSGDGLPTPGSYTISIVYIGIKPIHKSITI